jgi:YfiH family protein
VIPAPAPTLVFEAGGDTVQIRTSTIADGDFHIEGPRAALTHRRDAFAAGVWTQLDEVHGTRVVEVASPGEHDFEVGDGMVTRCRGAVLAVWVGDCAPVVFVGADGALAAAHAGWRGALAGVLQRTVTQMHSSGVRAFLGPCIHTCCYAFGAADLEQFVARFGPQVAARTAGGVPALDMKAVVRAALDEVDVDVVDLSRCTGCNPDHHYSHRRRQQLGRQVMTICKRATR